MKIVKSRVLQARPAVALGLTAGEKWLSWMASMVDPVGEPVDRAKAPPKS